MALSRKRQLNGVLRPVVDCEASVFVGACVKIDGGVAKNALADSEANSQVVGFCVAKSSSTKCTVRFMGLSESVFVGLTDTTDYYLSPSTPGGITQTPPTGSGEIILSVGRAFSATEIDVKVGTRIKRA